MRFEGQESIGAPRERVWAWLIDPRQAAGCVPGIGALDVVDESHFEVTKVGVGTIRADVRVQVEQVEIRAAEHVRYRVTGRARGVSIRADASLDLAAGASEGTSLLDWTIDIELAGPLAPLAGRMVERSAGSLVAQTVRCMDARLRAGSGMEPVAPPCTEAAVRRFDPNWCLFWGMRLNSAQLDIWMPYIRRSRHRFAIMTPDDIPDAERRRIADLHNAIVVEPYVQGQDWLRGCPGFRGYLYVGTRPENFQTINRDPDRAHVFIGHGESGKGTSGFRTASLYDSILVADYGVVRRFPRAVRPWVWRGALAIGAAVVEGVRQDAWARPRPVRTILYAPTWEGNVGDDCSSVEVVGPVLRRLAPELAARRIDLLVRPHPATGGRLPELKGVVDDLRAAGVVTEMTKARAFTRADVLISDVSGVTAEFLLTEKPTIMPIIPKLAAAGRDAAWFEREYPWAYAWDGTPDGLRTLLGIIETRDPLRARRAAAAKRKFRGHHSIEDAVRTFDLALDALRWHRTPVPLRVPYELGRVRARLRGRMRRLARRALLGLRPS